MSSTQILNVQHLDLAISLEEIYITQRKLVPSGTNLGIRALDSSAVSGQRLAKQANSNLCSFFWRSKLIIEKIKIQKDKQERE